MTADWKPDPGQAPPWVPLSDEPSEPERPASAPRSVDVSTANSYLDKALTAEVDAVATAPNGTRNHTLNRAAYNLGQLVGSGALDQGQVWSALSDAAERCGLKQREIDRTLRSGLGQGMSNPRAVPERNGGQPARPKQVAGRREPPDSEPPQRDYAPPPEATGHPFDDPPPRSDTLAGATTAETAWGAPQPLIVGAPKLPQELPRPIGDIVQVVAEATQTPRDLGFFTALGTVTTATRGRVTVRLRRDWDEPLTIFAMPVASSGERKSKVRSLIGGPLDDIEAAVRKEERDQYLKDKADYELEKKKVAAALRKATNAAVDGDDDAEPLKQDYLTKAKEFGKKDEPCELRLTADDVTPEQLGVDMARQGGALGILSAEGGFLGTVGGRYSGGIPNLDLILKSHSGEPVKVDRISRPSIEISHPALTLVLVVQPDVLRELTANQTFVRRGLAARFLYTQPASVVGQRNIDVDELDDYFHNKWTNLIRKIFDVKGERFLRLDGGAAERFADFRIRHEPQLRHQTGSLDQVREWGSKLPGQIARIAGIFTLVENPAAKLVSDAAMQHAIGLANYLAAHAVAALAGAPRNEAAIDVAAWIQRERPKQFSIRDVHRHLQGRAWCTGADAVRNAVSALDLASWVQLDTTVVVATQRGRPPSETYLVNPAVVADPAGVPRLSVDTVTTGREIEFFPPTTTNSSQEGGSRSSDRRFSTDAAPSDSVDKNRSRRHRSGAVHGPDVTCEVCGSPLTGLSVQAKFCSKACGQVDVRRRKQAAAAAAHAEATTKLLADLDAGYTIVINLTHEGPHAHLIKGLEESGRLVHIHRPLRGETGPRSPWANPYRLADPGNDAERARVIEAYRTRLEQHPELLAQIGDLRGKALGCFCWPRPCHGNVLAELANAAPAEGLRSSQPAETAAAGSAPPEPQEAAEAPWADLDELTDDEQHVVAELDAGRAVAIDVWNPDDPYGRLFGVLKPAGLLAEITCHMNSRPGVPPWAVDPETSGLAVHLTDERRRQAVRSYQLRLTTEAKHNLELRDQLDQLRGKALWCWCPSTYRWQDMPAHSDVLAELVNAETEGDTR